jgi:hypothetical protein
VFDWLFEGRSEIYWLLGILALILVVVWWRVRKRNLLLAAGGVAALTVIYFFLSTIHETPRAQVKRKLHEMGDAVKARNAEGIFKHVANDFKFRGQDRATFRRSTETVLSRGLIDEVVIYGETWPEGSNERTLLVDFMAKPKGGGLGEQPAYPVKAKFVREEDGQWRMQTFDVYNPVLQKERMEIPLP